jgi:hypothetical protein
VQAAEEFEQTVEDGVREMPTKADVSRVERKAKRGNQVTIAIVALIAIAALVWGYINSQETARVAAANEINYGSIQVLNAARDQLKAQGVPEKDLPPIVQAPAPGQPVDINALAQAAAALVLADIRTDPAFRGPEGGRGADGKPCDPIDNVLCRGPGGAPGENGTNGVDGKNGENGTNGVDGRDGEDGEDAPKAVSASFVDLNGGPGIDCVYRTVYDNGAAIDAPTPSTNCFDRIEAEDP